MNALTAVAVLVAEKLAGRRIDAVGFIDRLLETSLGAASLRFSAPSEDALLVEVAGLAPATIPLDSAPCKLRMLCARLAVLLSDACDSELYDCGGKLPASPAVNGKAACASRWHVQMRNAPGCAHFELTAAAIQPALCGSLAPDDDAGTA